MKSLTAPSPANAEEEISDLIATLHKTGKRLEDLTGGEVDAVADPEGGSFLLRSAQDHLRSRQAAKQAAILDALPAYIAMIDSEGTILSVNEAWRQFAYTETQQHPGHAVGLNYLGICDKACRAGSLDACAVAEGVRAVLRGTRDFSFEYACHMPTERRWFLMKVAPLADSGGGVVVMHLNITERKLAEEVLRESEGRFRGTFEQAAVGIAHVSTEGRFLRVNDKLCDILGYGPGDLRGRNFTELTLPEDHSRAHEARRAMMEGTQTSFTTEKQYRRKDGELCWVNLVTTLERSPEGYPKYFISIFEDISARKRLEDSLHSSQAALRMAARLSQMGPWSVELPGGRVTWSEEVCAIHDTPPGAAPTVEQALNYFAPEYREAASLAFETCTRDGTPYDLELQIITQTGRRIWVRYICEAERDETGEIRRVQGNLQDITERKQAEQRMAEQAALIDETRDAISVCDLDLRITFWSKGAERLYGWTAEEAKGGLLHEILRVDADQSQTANRAVRQAGEWNGEIQMTSKAGAVLMVDGRWTLRRDALGQPHSILTVDTDVTERKKSERQILRSQRMESIGTLAGGIAHDLNNVLAPILMGVDFLKLQYPEASSILDCFETSANRGAGMVHQLLTFAKGSEGERVSIQASHLVMEMKELMQGTFPKNIELRVSFDTGLPTVLGDASQLHQILLNLCVNARDAMPFGGTLTVDARRLDVDAVFAAAVPDAKPGRYVVLRVSDTGTGIASAELDRIFDPFFTTKGPDKGSGLGLSTVMGIVKGFGGFIQVHSTLGEGSTFSVHLPAEMEACDRKPLAVLEPSFFGRGETILLVDDEAAVLNVGSLVLTALKYRVVTATDGAEALEKALEHREELRAVITDIHMPHMDGLAFARALYRVLPNIPVIVSTGRLDETAAEDLKLLGIIHRLDKPYRQHLLATMVAKVLRAGEETSA